MYPYNWRYFTVKPSSLTKEDCSLDYAVNHLKDKPIISLDTETEGLDPLKHELVSVQLACPDFAYVIQMRDYTPIEINAKLKHLVESKLVLIQYSPFDTGFLAKHLNIRPRNIYDTAEAEKDILGPLVRRGWSLKAMMLKYLGEEVDKAIRVTFRKSRGLSYEQAKYAAIDALALFPIAFQQGLHRANNGLHMPKVEEMYKYIDGKIFTMPKK